MTAVWAVNHAAPKPKLSLKWTRVQPLLSLVSIWSPKKSSAIVETTIAEIETLSLRSLNFLSAIAAILWKQGFTDFITNLSNVPSISTSCSRFSKKLLVISQKVAQKANKSCFLYRELIKNVRRNKNVFWSDAKIFKLYNKSKISKHFCAILRRNQRCQITLSSIKPKNVMNQ